jgi:bacterioferritin
MATREELIARLNDVLAWELAGVIQYMHGAVLVGGKWRLGYQSFFHDGSKEARDHAEAVGNKVVALGGVPTVEPAKIRQGTSIDELLENALLLEQDALAAWERALEVGDAVNLGTKLWIEEMITHEQEHVDDLMKLTGKAGIASSGSGGASATRTA